MVGGSETASSQVQGAHRWTTRKASSTEHVDDVLLLAVTVEHTFHQVEPPLTQVPAEAGAYEPIADGVVKQSGEHDTSGPMTSKRFHVARVARAKDSLSLEATIQLGQRQVNGKHAKGRSKAYSEGEHNNSDNKKFCGRL